MAAMFGTAHSTDHGLPKPSLCFEDHCYCQRMSRMEDQSPTPSFSRPSSSISRACDHEWTSPPELSPLWITGDNFPIKTEDSHRFATNLQHALHNVESYPQTPERDLCQYIAVGDTQPPYYEGLSPQFLQYPAYQEGPLQLSYGKHPFGPLSPACSTMMESPVLNQFPRTYVWPSPQPPCNSSDERRGGTLLVMSSEEEEEADALRDKPYARLIYDALMQAPSHKMTLREIYEWFQIHTNKPADSGNTGWQNSIRHNLSMNQAFENDKSELPDGTGQKQKANSVWLLTEDAVKNGVQSTTRYRKTGSGKRTNANRSPAPIRQRSGAKGGQAARRAAHLRKKEHLFRRGLPTSSPLEFSAASMYDYENRSCNSVDSSVAFSPLIPTTPIPGCSVGVDMAYQSPHLGTCAATSPACSTSGSAYIAASDQDMHDYGCMAMAELTWEDMLGREQDSAASSLLR